MKIQTIFVAVAVSALTVSGFAQGSKMKAHATKPAVTKAKAKTKAKAAVKKVAAKAAPAKAKAAKTVATKKKK
ncbi:hypothetical protein [Fimbriimonas ginsengisoli]|uniref:Uncharacterized protein n=1 Tax=Fimbriimonas ginsengisoli Gsoil 348 TaxID=661478 RepID=A0A068NT69_FIMGI|nr:hypothetical protein [Fimbriimonas ginsengisoli]AIE86743.1 hypothetical protein OP10G_3375 [Fimbriimonas ginsengisoli Gsoil 348]